MSDVKTAIMDAAERRMQLGGFGGFSFREIAADVGIKSSSVHYHFPTKEDLAAAVIRRWAEETSEIDRQGAGEGSRSRPRLDEGLPRNCVLRRTHVPLHRARRRLAGSAAEVRRK